MQCSVRVSNLSQSRDAQGYTFAGYGLRKIMRKGDYFNLAQLLGKTHLDYVSPLNATILRTPDGGLSDWNHVNFVGDVRVDLKVSHNENKEIDHDSVLFGSLQCPGVLHLD